MAAFEEMIYWMKKPWVIALYTVLVVLVFLFMDKPLASYLHHLDLRKSIHSLSILTAFGQLKIYLVLFVFSGLYFHFIKVNSLYEARSWYLLFCLLLANLVCFVLKVILSRARPDLLFLSHEYGFYWFKLNKFYWSFPSGHTTTVVSLAAGLGVLFPRYFYAFLSVALLVAVSRVLLYYHYLSDVLTACYISLLFIGFFTQHLKKNNWVIGRNHDNRGRFKIFG